MGNLSKPLCYNANDLLMHFLNVAFTSLPLAGASEIALLICNFQYYNISVYSHPVHIK